MAIHANTIKRSNRDLLAAKPLPKKSTPHTTCPHHCVRTCDDRPCSGKSRIRFGPLRLRPKRCRLPLLKQSTSPHFRSPFERPSFGRLGDGFEGRGSSDGHDARSASMLTVVRRTPSRQNRSRSCARQLFELIRAAVGSAIGKHAAACTPGGWSPCPTRDAFFGSASVPMARSLSNAEPSRSIFYARRANGRRGVSLRAACELWAFAYLGPASRLERLHVWAAEWELRAGRRCLLNHPPRCTFDAGAVGRERQKSRLRHTLRDKSFRTQRHARRSFSPRAAPLITGEAWIEASSNSEKDNLPASDISSQELRRRSWGSSSTMLLLQPFVRNPGYNSGSAGNARRGAIAAIAGK